jgi:hypothetical protein
MAFLKDLRHAFRVLRHNKRWTDVVLASLALAIGANMALFTTAVLSHGQDQARGIPLPKMPEGRATISGVVLTDAGAPAPGATVELAWHHDPTGAGAYDGYSSETTTADANGHFAFTAVSQHAVDLSASLGEWARVEFGQAGPGLPGTPIRLSDAERLAVTLKLARGASLAGTVFENNGKPAAGIHIYAFRMKPISDTDQVMAEGGDAITDEHGVWSIGRLPPGRFIVSAGWRFFRDTPDRDSADPIELEAGEQRTGVDVHLRPTPVTTVSGVVRDVDDKPAAGVRLWLAAHDGPFREQATSGLNGAFEITGVSAGHYDLVAVLRDHAAHLDVVSNGNSPVRVEPRLRLEPGAVVRGSILLAPGVTQPMPQFTWVFLSATSGVRRYTTNDDGQQQATPDFTYRGVPPGTYSLDVSNVERAGLRVKSVIVDNVDAKGLPFEVTAASQHDVLITLTDQLATLSGLVADSIGRPGLEYTVVVFSTDERFWSDRGGDRWRRIFAERPDTHGQYVIRDLTAGEYAVALAPPDLYGQPPTKLLRELLPSAQRITIRDGQVAVCNIRSPQ